VAAHQRLHRMRSAAKSASSPVVFLNRHTKKPDRSRSLGGSAATPNMITTSEPNNIP
jgi:hypothetical protein